MSDLYRDEYLTLNGCRMHYLDWGNPSAPPLLMVHGLTRQGHSFDGTARRLRDTYHCMAIDVRGRGESDWTPPETYNYSQYVADVEAFLDALGINQTHYIGTSMGGHIAMNLAAERPELFLSLVLNDIGPETAQAGSEKIQAFVTTQPAALPSVEAWLKREAERTPWVRDLPMEDRRAAIQWQLRHNEDGSWSLRGDPEIYRGRLRDPEARRKGQALMWRGLRALTCPLLLVRGEETDLLDMSTVAAMQEAQPTMSVMQVPGVGHAPSLNESPAAEAVSRFFA